MKEIRIRPTFDRPQSGRRVLFAKGANMFSVAAEQGQDFCKVLSPDSLPLVRLCSMEDLRQMLDKAGLLEPIKVR